MGAPTGPQAPQRSQRPGGAVALLWIGGHRGARHGPQALIWMGAPRWPPNPPMLRPPRRSRDGPRHRERGPSAFGGLGGFDDDAGVTAGGADGADPAEALGGRDLVSGHADLVGREAEGGRQALDAEAPRMGPEKLLDQAAVRIQARTVPIASRTASPEPEMRYLTPCMRGVISRVQPRAVHQESTVLVSARR